MKNAWGKFGQFRAQRPCPPCKDPGSCEPGDRLAPPWSFSPPAVSPLDAAPPQPEPQVQDEPVFPAGKVLKKRPSFVRLKNWGHCKSNSLFVHLHLRFASSSTRAPGAGSINNILGMDRSWRYRSGFGAPLILQRTSENSLISKQSSRKMYFLI